MKTKFAIGCLVQWYECNIIDEYVDSLKDALDHYDGNVVVDFTICANQELEVCEDEQTFADCLIRLKSSLADHRFSVNLRRDLVTISDYRREFNDKYCNDVDVLIWGETDMIAPKQMFTSLDVLHQSTDMKKYIATFAICKMWDDSWKQLEHPEFTDKPFVHGDGENWWQLRYTMTKDEMNTFNNSVEDLDVRVITPHKFNGCGLVISSEVVKAGVNIPKSCFFIKEDTAFMLMTQRVLGQIPQYHFRNILMVHNRKHPDKRMYIKGESSEYIDDQRSENGWYMTANRMCEQNNANLFNAKYKSFTWNDVWKDIK